MSSLSCVINPHLSDFSRDQDAIPWRIERVRQDRTVREGVEYSTVKERGFVYGNPQKDRVYLAKGILQYEGISTLPYLSRYKCRSLGVPTYSEAPVSGGSSSFR